MLRNVSTLLVVALVLLGAVAPAHAQQTVLRASVFSAGAGDGAGPNLRIQSTVGPVFVGRSASSGFALNTGFWHQARPAAVPLALPTAGADEAVTDEDTPVVVNVLANDADPNGEALRIIALTGATHGSALVNGTVITYTPQADFFGDDSFSYTVANTVGGTASATVTVTVNPVNDAPRFISTPSTTATAGTIYRYTVETTDVEDDPLALTAPTRPPWLSFQDNGDGTALLSGTPTNADIGEHAVTLAVSDGALAQQQSFTVTVEAGGLAAPQLVAPEDGAVVTTPTARLRWNPVPGVTAYDVQVDTEADFSSPAEARGVPNTEVEVTGLPQDATIFWRVRAVDASGPGPFSAAFRFTTATNVATESEDAVPTEYALHPNYPNPFNPTTTIAYDLAQAAEVRLVVYDLFGREVKTLVHKQQAAGRYTVVFDADGLASGTYFYRIEAGAWSQVRQFVLLR